MGKYFGDDGYRGEVNLTINPVFLYKIGRFLGWRCKNNLGQYTDVLPRIVIGIDTRRSSKMLESAVAAGITASGTDVYLLDIISTPAVAYITKNHNFYYGVMITASHNPYFDNGIKIFTTDGEKADESLLLQIEEYIDRESDAFDNEDITPFARRDEIGRVIPYEAGPKAYKEFLLSKISAQSPLKVALDCSNGVSSLYAREIFSNAAPACRIINDSPNGVNINLDCGATHIECLRAFMRENDMDIGFAFDGDADRCIVVDEAGEVLDGDQLLYVLARYLDANNRLKGNTVVGTLMTNIGLVHSLKKVGINCELTAVGDRAVYQYMKKHDYALGGENVGHIIFKDYATTGDGILSAIMILNVLSSTKKKLSSIAGEMKKYPHVCRNVITKYKREVVENMCVKREVERVKSAMGEKGRVVLRPSGIEDIVRVMVEHESQELCDQYAAEIEAVCVDTIKIIQQND